MAIVQTDIKVLKTTNNLGGAKTATEVAGTAEELFPNLTAPEAVAGGTRYACVYIENTHGTDTYFGALVFINQLSTSTDTAYRFAVGSSGEGGTEQTIANQSTAPTGVTFVTPDEEAEAIVFGDMVPGDYYPLWLAWDIDAGAAGINPDQMIFRVKGGILPDPV